MQQEVIHPNWPTMYPRLLTDGKLVEVSEDEPSLIMKNDIYALAFLRPLTKKNKQYLWECEQERFVYKSCLRKVIGLQRTAKHTSWNTAEISNLQLT
jgi:hypothetical protein